jgi:hypothetical protein
MSSSISSNWHPFYKASPAIPCPENLSQRTNTSSKTPKLDPPSPSQSFEHSMPRLANRPKHTLILHPSLHLIKNPTN